MKTYGTGNSAADQAGFLVIHCGHPTALWPYYIQTPSHWKEHMALAPNGRAFQYLADCQAAARLLHTRHLVLGGPHWRNCVVPEAGGPTDTSQDAILRSWAAIRHDRLTRAQRRKAGAK